MARHLLLVVALVTVGCDATQSVRAGKPVRVDEFPGKQKMIAGCVAEQLTNDAGIARGLTPLLRDDPQDSIVSFRWDETFGIIWEVRFHQSSPSTTKVELRKWGAGITPSEKTIWEMVGSCAGEQTAPKSASTSQ